MLTLPALWAVHISDGVLRADWQVVGFVLAGLLLAFGAWRVRDEEIAPIALTAAAFFVASQIHVRVGPSSVHLLLNGLAGVTLGRRAALAIPLGLFLQAALFQHGGFASLGINTCIMVLPALAAALAFTLLRRGLRSPTVGSVLVGISILTWVLSLAFSLPLLWNTGLKELTHSEVERALHNAFTPLVLGVALVLAVAGAWLDRKLRHGPEFAMGLFLGQTAVLLTIALNAGVLLAGGVANWDTVVLAILVIHLPVAAGEGLILGFTVGFLARVKPEMLGLEAAAPVAERSLPLHPEDEVCSRSPVS